MAIPKIIHYCWLSNEPVPKKFQQCMASWHTLMPDYEFWKWDFSRFPQGKIAWVDEAFAARKYAFAADYIRLFALYNHGGIYMDMDVEVLKPFDDLLERREFIGWEHNGKNLEVAVFGTEAHVPWLQAGLNYYEEKHFDANRAFQEISPIVILKAMQTHGWGVTKLGNPKPNCVEIFPSDYFSPKNWTHGKLHVTSNTYCIHHFSDTWVSTGQRWEKKFWNLLGLKTQHVTWHLDKLLRKIGLRK